MSKILILGSTGYLGDYLTKYLISTRVSIYTQSRRKNSNTDFCIDLTSISEIIKCLNNINPDIVINLAAETNVDFCERNERIAYQANALNIQNLVNAINGSNTNSYLINISTDQVYSGKGPHNENEANPVNIYGKTKLLGEKNALNLKNCVVLRTNFIGSDLKNESTISDWIIKSLRKTDKISVFENVYFNPLYIETLCEQVYKIIEFQPQGIYNLGSQGRISKADFALNICRGLALDEKLLTHKNVEEMDLIAKRPNDMTMQLDKYSKKMNIVLPSIENEVEKLINFYRMND